LAADKRSAYLDALRLLAGRELTATQLRERLADREHDREDIDSAIERLLDTKALDDARVAAAYVRTALKVKGRGRLRIQRELQEMGVGRDVASEALAEAFGDVDERALVAQALEKKLRGNQTIASAPEYARVFQYLIRQGFSPGAITTVLRARRKGVDPLE
jgi:regulatory protein